MEVMRAKNAGFCFGVEQAINKAFDTIKDLENAGKRILTCGQLIHNKAVTDRLAGYGVGRIDRISEASQGDVVIIRSHGEPEEFYLKAEERGVRIVDTTCPFVSKIHKLVHEA